MNDRSYQRSSHAVGSKSSGGRVPLQPITTKVYSSSQGRVARTKSGIKLKPAKGKK